MKADIWKEVVRSKILTGQKMKTEIAFCKMSFNFCLGYLQTCSPTDSFTISQNDPD